MTRDANAQLRRTRGIARSFVGTLGGPVHYRHAGSGRPLVLLHQANESSLQWSLVMPLVGESCWTLAPDIPGYGDSYTPERQPSFSEYAGLVIEFLDAVGIDRADFLGFHLGASLVVEVAANYPSRVDRLLLSGLPDFSAGIMPNAAPSQIDPGARSLGDGLVALPKFTPTNLTFGAPATRLSPDGSATGSPPDMTASLSEYVADILATELPLETELWSADRALSFLITRLQALPYGHWMMHAGIQQRVRDLLPRIDAPTLLFWAVDDVVASIQPGLAALMPNATTAVIREARKMPMDSAPEAFARIALSYLKSPADGRRAPGGPT